MEVITYKTSFSSFIRKVANISSELPTFDFLKNAMNNAITKLGVAGSGKTTYLAEHITANDIYVA